MQRFKPLDPRRKVPVSIIATVALLGAIASGQPDEYDIAADPLEKTDLKQKNSQVVSQLMAQLDEWKTTLPNRPTGDVFSNERTRVKSESAR